MNVNFLQKAFVLLIHLSFIEFSMTLLKDERNITFLRQLFLTDFKKTCFKT